MQKAQENFIFYQCNGASCRKKKGKLLDHYIKKYKLQNKVDVQQMGCNDKCNSAPVLHLHPADIWLSEKDLGTVLKKYVLNK